MSPGWQAAGFSLEFGFVVAGSLALFQWIGLSLDARWDTAPAFRIVGILLALLLSGLWSYRRIQSLP